MEWWKYLIIGFVALIVLCIIFYAINRAFRRRYGFSLYGGAALMLLAIACVVGGIFLRKDSTFIAYGLFGVAGLLTLITLIYDIKKCGGVGFFALILQIIFSVPVLVVVIDIFTNKGRSTIMNTSDYGRRSHESYQDYEAYRRRNNRNGRY